MNEFVREKPFDSPDGYTTVEFSEITKNGKNGFKIIVKPSGINFRGELFDSISTENDLQNFAMLIVKAWEEHKRISPKIVTTLSGH